MKVGDVWHDIDGNKYEVIDITEDEREDGSIVRNIISEPVEN